MAAEAHGMQGDLPISGAARAARRRVEAAFVAPVTLGRPRWQRRYRRAALALHAAVLGSSPGVHLLWQQVVPRPLIATVLSVAVSSIVGRWALHGCLLQLRRYGRAMSTVLSVGDAATVAALVDRTRRAPGVGWRVVAACTPTGAGPDGTPSASGVPVIGDLDGVAALALAHRVDVVSVTPAPGWTSVRLQHLASDLDHSHTALAVDPRLLKRAGPRMRVRRVDGLPLVRVSHPAFGPGVRVLKGVADRTVALLALLVVLPVLLACAVAVRRDGGPALLRRSCRGRAGHEFELLTFRTTARDSEAPTRLGSVLRRYCIDELPQLLNMLSGSMALIGPRPQVLGEDPADRTARRHLLVKPGLTGLWQLDGDTEAGADASYVAQWTPALDARILLRTLRVAVRGGSAR